MNPTRIGILINKLIFYRKKWRVFVFKLRGLKIQDGSALGKISCDWHNKLFIGSNCELQDDIDFRIWQPFDKESFIKIGDRVFIGHGCEFVCNCRITIGNDCLIASNSTFVDVGHEYNKSSIIKSQACTVGEITVGDDVWIGTSCVILQGVTIGRGSIIGAGSVVNKSIPEYQIWAGSPARFLKYRT